MPSREELVQESHEAVRRGSGEFGSDADHLGAMLEGVRLAILAAIAEPAPPAVQEAPRPPLSTWALLELMGYRVIVGYVEEDDLAGRRMLRVRRLHKPDRPPGLGEPNPPLELKDDWELYGAAAVYAFKPLDEDGARKAYLGRDPYNDDIPF